MVTIYGDPKGKGRPRFWNGHAVTPKTTREYERLVAFEYKRQEGKMHDGPVGIKIKAYLRIPKSTSKKNKAAMVCGNIKPTKKPDTDNIIKIVLDGLNGLAYQDDKQVTALYAAKMYGVDPRVEIEVYDL